MTHIHRFNPRRPHVIKAMQVLRPFHSAMVAWELRELANRLETYESPGFTAHQALYWLAREFHCGQGSEGYRILSTSPYHASLAESSYDLRNIDADFDSLYGFLEPFAAESL
ncbi:MAG: hypothetical protein HC886_23880 [Leptolyngbyaceae cyanobacterium SM1_1_3]|nr:hypothetical protein [Leptolyngbyaceae cyanobacterium SM1_1_3]